MSQTTVEEILAAVQQLPGKERTRLSELLARESTAEDQIDASGDRIDPQLPPRRHPEMQWLLDHPEFWEQHRGEHVALSGYQMIAAGKTRKEVVAEARRRGIKFPFVQYLPKEEREWLLGVSNQPAAEF